MGSPEGLRSPTGPGRPPKSPSKSPSWTAVRSAGTAALTVKKMSPVKSIPLRIGSLRRPTVTQA